MENISKNVTYKEATKSNTATKLGLDNNPGETELEAMKLVAENVFQPLRKKFGRTRVNSFFRSEALNKALRGSKTSQHRKGEAMDVDALDGTTNKEIFDYIRENLDQLIGEGLDYDGDYSWVHFSYKKEGNRKQVLTMLGGKYFNYRE